MPPDAPRRPATSLALVAAYILATLTLIQAPTHEDNFPDTILQACIIMSESELEVPCYFSVDNCSSVDFQEAAEIPYDHQIITASSEKTLPSATDTNISLAYSPLVLSENLVIMVEQWSYDKNTTEQRILCWSITFPKNKSPKYGCLNLVFKRTQEDYDRWKVSPNLYNYSEEVCQVSADSINPTLQAYPETRSLRLAMNLNMTTAASIDLYSGNCSTVICTGSNSGCDMHDTRILKHTKKGKMFELDFHDLSAEYHCVRMVFPCLIGCRPFCTLTVKLDPQPPPPPVPPGTLIFYTVSACIVIVLLLIITVYFLNKRLDQFQVRPRHITLDVESDENGCMLPPNILLLYSRDSSQFCEVVVAFKLLLEKYAGVRVYDPLDQSQIEEVSCNMSGWLTLRLNEPNVKVVLIISEGAALRQQAMLKNKQLVFKNPHSLDPIFTYALKQLHENPVLSQDYSRIFPVRFEDFATDDMILALITPHKCFVLLKHFENLISEILVIKSEPGISMDTLEKDCKAEFHNLKEALEKMKEFRQQNPDFMRAQCYLSAI